MFISFKTWRAIGGQQLYCLLEMGFLILSTCGAAVRTVPKILKMAY